MPNDNNDKNNYSDSNDSSANDAAGPIRSQPALMIQATGKGKTEGGGNKLE